MKTYIIYKKRDGQFFKEESSISADNFTEACQIFAKQMTDDNWEKNNNIVWLDQLAHGVEQTGWYDLDASVLVEGGENDEPDYSKSDLELLVSEESIREGFSSWSEDVYTWEVRDELDYLEVYDMDDFETNKESYSFFMAVDASRFFLYNGKFNDISEREGFGYYDYRSDKFIGCTIDEIEVVKTYLD